MLLEFETLSILIAGPRYRSRQAVMRHIARAGSPSPDRTRVLIEEHGLPTILVEALDEVYLWLDPKQACRGLLFVADAGPRGFEDNHRILDWIELELREAGQSLEALPRVLLVDRSDTADSIEPAQVAELLDTEAPFFAGVSRLGIGVEDALRVLLHRCLGRAEPARPRLQVAACDQRWDSLDGDGPLLRRCRRCQRDVRRVSLPWQALSEIRAGRCVAASDPRLFAPQSFELRAQRLPRIGPWPCFIEHGFQV